MSKITTFKSDNLLINIYNNRKELGYAAASDTASKIKELLSHKKELNMVFAAAPSQDEFLEELTKIHGIQWHRINAFHLDEYIGLSEDAPQRFGRYLHDRIFSKVPFKSVNYLNGNAEDIQAECERYGKLMPGKNKAVAVKSAVESPVSEKCPASILRKHSNAVLYLDEDSASELEVAKN
ncbi:hypothetical protein [Thermoanaerobacterium sp. DL9XJH110]|uniref:hypothetical protein n=1 Tax=Thermoanaerobacterium sp. DL9XJH110 TaxID=3386643 RepID=UPI003BB73D77